MADVNKVKQYLAEENSLAFLVEYLSLQEAGYNVPIPSALELAGVMEGWSQIFDQTLQARPSHEFTEELSTIWLDTVKKQGGKVSEGFASEMINILTGRMPPVSSSASKTLNSLKPPTPPPVSGVEPQSYSAENTTYHAAPAIHEVVSHISEDYRSAQSLKKTQVLSFAELMDKAQLALENNDEIDFLYFYVSTIKHNEMPEVPLELSHEFIRIRWEKIISDKFHYYCDDNFYDKLADQWVNLVHIAGPIISNDAYHKILDKLEIQFAKKSKILPSKPPRVETSPKKSIFNNILNFFK